MSPTEEVGTRAPAYRISVGELGFLRSPEVPWVAKWGGQVAPTLFLPVCSHYSMLKLAGWPCIRHCKEYIRPEAVAAAAVVETSAVIAVMVAAADAEGGDNMMSDAVVVDAAPSVASMDSSLETTPNVSGGGAAAAPGCVVSPMQVDGDGTGSGA